MGPGPAQATAKAGQYPDSKGLTLSGLPDTYGSTQDLQGETMSVSREEIEVISTDSADRCEWVRPAVLKLDAGSAETGSNVVTDLGVTFS